MFFKTHHLVTMQVNELSTLFTFAVNADWLVTLFLIA